MFCVKLYSPRFVVSSSLLKHFPFDVYLASDEFVWCEPAFSLVCFIDLFVWNKHVCFLLLFFCSLDRLGWNTFDFFNSFYRRHSDTLSMLSSHTGTPTSRLLWSPCGVGQTIIFLPCGFYLSSFFFSSPNLSGRRLDVYHTSTHDVALVRI